ncbi:putative PAS/PAC sensor protein [Solidesulfovibrio fructosivorans JJ]]|uniref:histidine kinase n=1 Tax=Solidesulfovibrio fructosivorans JJ] TaxID=596151 RepID=E1JVK4_SOLFR|nr:PAS-domain containing protein [Solidesulfovibrio fructosivorans]EFL51492.1 putative PAS/PAC sensor protein [Solidesulfovibrio fructosivorans JJ]]
MANRSIRLHFLLWTWGFFLLVLCGVFIFVTNQAERALVEEAEQRAKSSLDMVAFLLAREPGLKTETDLAHFADTLGTHLGLRFTYVVSGRVVADSAVRAEGVAAMEDHAGRPEVRQAEAGGIGKDVRKSRTLGRDMVYVAKAYAGGNGVPAGILRLALPVSALGGELSRFRDALLAVLALVFLAGGVAAFGLARGMSRSIGEIANVVAAVGQGHYDRRIHIVPARDFAPLAAAINVLAERIGDHVREIEEHRQRQEAVFESMAEGVVILDGQERIVAANRALREMFPKKADIVGRSPLEAGMPLCVERSLAAFDPEAGVAQRVGRFELQNTRVTEVTVAALPGDPDTAGRVVTFHDVTEAATMDRIFRDFVIDASHNLRTPLTKVRGFAETALTMLTERPDGAPENPPAPADGLDGTAMAKALSAVVRAADDMKAIIDDLLAAARDRYAAARAAAASDALSALKQAMATHAPLFRAKTVTARLETPPPGSFPVLAGHEAMVRAFGSLLSQTPNDVSLTVSVTREAGFVEVRFMGPANLDLVLPEAELAPYGGEAALNGAVRVVRLPLAGA